MKGNFLPNVEKYRKAHQQKSRWYKVVMCLAIVVVFCTTYALILPAITMEKQTYCRIDSHVHEDNCYKKYIICGQEESTEAENSHIHTEACYASELICGQEEHTHEAGCYVNLVEDEVVVEEGQDNETSTIVPINSIAAEITEPESITKEADKKEIETSSEPLKVEEYVNDAKLYYKTEESEDWIEIKGDTSSVPGNASFRLEVKYNKVNIADLINAGYQMEYTLPDLLRNPVASGTIVSDGKNVGTITADGKEVTLSLDPNWVTEQQSANQTEISGDFYVEAELDLSTIKPSEGPGTIKVGDVEIKINYEDDIIAKNAYVKVEKTLGTISKEGDNYYLSYSLKVTAGPDGCPAVKVEDEFTQCAEWVDSYVIESEKTVSITGENPGKLVWNLGDMRPNASETLEYKVKLKNGYLDLDPKNATLKNTAAVYLKTYKRDDTSVSFTPKGEATMSKTAAEFVPDENGGGTIQYTVWIKADEKNNYTLENVVIRDSLDGTVPPYNNSTNIAFREYLSYDEKSFVLKNDTDGETIEIVDSPIFSEEKAPYNTAFEYNVGALKPGESRTLTYTLKVNPGIFTVSSDGEFRINNRAGVFTKGTTGTQQKYLNYYNCWKDMKNKVWSRKLVGSKELEDQTISLGTDSCYKIEGTKISPMTNEGKFTVPKGSYKYQVVANEKGDWDLSSAVMTDTLQDNGYMQYVGYVQVSAYKLTDGEEFSSDANAVNALKAATPEKTVWVKIEELKSFEFHPKEIGLEGEYAYLLTYYAMPKNLNAVTTVVVANEFSLSGTVGFGGIPYELTGIKVNAKVELEGGNFFGAHKEFWYYDPTPAGEGATATGYKNGALYWVIKVEGKVIPKGTQIQDDCDETTNDTHLYGTGEKQFIGVYKGKADSGFEAYTDIEKFKQSGNFKEQGLTVFPWDADDSYNTTTADTDFQCINKGGSLTFKVNKDISLENDEALYFILSTSPKSVPVNDRDSKTYNNTLLTSDAAAPDEWVTHNTASTTLYGNDGIFKEHGKTFTYDGSGSNEGIKIIHSTKDVSLTASEIPAAGTYVAWQVQVNFAGTLSGRYRIIEQIPEGMELTYVKLFWRGSKAGNSTMPRIEGLGAEWTEHYGAGNESSYYYTNGQQAIWDVDELIAGHEAGDKYNVEFQILCRVTDPEVLQGGVKKEFDNEVILKNLDGIEIDRDSNMETIEPKTMNKKGTYDSSINGGRYPFKITVNDLGEDLVTGSNEITLVDELCDLLTIDPTTIKVINTKTEEEITGWKSSVDGQTLRLTLPDDKPLTITYETTINAAPGQKINISNKAYWEGHSTGGGSSTSEDSFSYLVGGSVGSNKTPKIKITKIDQNNNQTNLPGAEFELCEVNNDFEVVNGGLCLKGTTDENGKLTFGENTGKLLSYNTIYRLTETKAPEGYVLDAKPHYFAVSQLVDGEHPTFPEGVTVWYNSSEYTYSAYNHKGEISVLKKFQDADGTELEKINGTYRFGIYENPQPSEKSEDPIKTVSIEFSGNTTENVTAKFKDLELNKTYYIYELDDTGTPITSNNVFTISGKPFKVTYDLGTKVILDGSGNVTINDVQTAAGEAALVVTNKINYPELPETGGNGTLPYRAAGILLILIAISFFWYRGRKVNIEC